LSTEASHGENEFGANEWLVEEMYEQYKSNPNSVDEEWRPTLERYAAHLASRAGAASASPVAAAAPAVSTPAPAAAPVAAAAAGEPSPVLVAKTTRVEAKPTPIPAQAPVTSSIGIVDEEATDQVTILKGMPKTLAANMDASISMPTATSVRTIPAKLMIDNRIVINSHLGRTRGGKVSFTHIIGFALIRALKEFPSQNVFYQEVDGKPAVVQPANINLGLAIDIPKPDGTRALLVPNIKRAQRLNFQEYLNAYEDMVKRARNNALTAADFQGTTISLTNPGGIGTVHSVPRLMAGAGSIIGAGALEYPAEFQGMSEAQAAKMGISKTITLTSTYDHRVIQGYFWALAASTTRSSTTFASLTSRFAGLRTSRPTRTTTAARHRAFRNSSTPTAYVVT
jgi:multifunctional 2-oxoglutarate metabolism enzyme